LVVLNRWFGTGGDSVVTGERASGASAAVGAAPSKLNTASDGLL